MENTSHTEDILEDKTPGDAVAISDICFELEMICRNYMKISQPPMVLKKIRRPKKILKQTAQKMLCKCGRAKQYYQYFEIEEEEKVFDELQYYQKRLFEISGMQHQLSKLKANLAQIQ